MLPSAKHSLEKGGMTEKAASWALVALFVGGAVGIQYLSRVMHHFLPSHVVDCDHTHDEEQDGEMDVCQDEESLQGDESDGTKLLCDFVGPCYGYSDPCGSDCFRNARARTEQPLRPGLARPVTTSEILPTERTVLLDHPSPSIPKANGHNHQSHNHAHQGHDHETQIPQTQHHHHVPTNAFLSLGLQTSIAIALHKLPEGFITYATNHANPKLGIAIFISLFIHNITEGFALALPLYLALHSRSKAMLWAALLGGLSQPLGAAIAALSFKLAGSADMQPGDTVYGIMFAVVAGVMTMVGLQLMGESIELTHNRGQCLTFAVVGMGILGVTGALTA
jgi:zinc transporter, ZIP family